MASLRTLLTNKNSSSLTETNLERGTIYSFTPANQYGGNLFAFCWTAPATGIAVVEAWGASGSGARMCCCGGGLPGNPGAYSKKTLCVTAASSYVCGSIGQSCGNADALNYRGRSQNTGLCWVTTACGNGCICAEGGIGGYSICSTGSPLYCCYLAANYCTTLTNAGCGIVCNFGSGAQAGCCAASYGGDTNCFGGFSCVHWRGCSPVCNCCFIYHVATSPGIYAKDGAVISYSIEQDVEFSKWSGQGYHSFIHALNAASKRPVSGNPYTACWAGMTACGCYENTGCMPFMAVGIPGLPPVPCGDVRDHGLRGGHGAVKIRFYTN